ncbi:two-component system, OmpR family, phosphate regulon response regulator PhoB [Bathymodiolus japonicus methanotrophic gill symbiont]|nr:two-component system, OmpR family, phosphate regulon response regulator PhoB [Bathymodiolus japonicus methanotrophic gill symbiont]
MVYNASAKQDAKYIMSQFTILVVEDEQAIRSMLVMVLQQYDFNVLEAADVAQAHTILNDNLPDLILLDWMLPRVTGDEWTRRLKSSDDYRDLPIILLTAKGEEADKIHGLDIGADDYVTKPFSPKELIARIKAVLRRSGKIHDLTQIKFQDIVLDTEQHRVIIADKEIEVSPTEFRLLSFFLTHPDKVYNRTQLLDQVWGRNVYIEERTVDVHIRRLRKILANHQREDWLQTVRGFGYRFSVKSS